jgi:hypothetical protein
MKGKVLVLAALIVACPVFAQKAKTTAKPAPAKVAVKPGPSALTDVHLFQNFLHDAPLAKTAFAQPTFAYSSYDGMSALNIGALGGLPVSPKIDIEGELYFQNNNYKESAIKDQSGLTNLDLYGKYNFKKDNKQIISAGVMLSLPIGKEELGYGKFNFGAFGAFRTALTNGMVITATAGLDFIEVPKSTGSVDAGFDADDWGFAKALKSTASKSSDTERQTRFNIGGGLIYPVNKQVNIVGELSMTTKVDFMMLSGGVDYLLTNGGRIRGGLGIGLDDGAPDLMIQAGYFINL